jgi:hypothetical protein
MFPKARAHHGCTVTWLLQISVVDGKQLDPRARKAADLHLAKRFADSTPITRFSDQVTPIPTTSQRSVNQGTSGF